MKKLIVKISLVAFLLGVSMGAWAGGCGDIFGTKMELMYVDALAPAGYSVWYGDMTREGCTKEWTATWKREDGKTADPEDFTEVKLSSDRATVFMYTRSCGYEALYKGQSVVTGTHGCGGGGGTFDLYMNQ